MNNDLPWFLQKGAHKCYLNPTLPYIVLDFETTNLEKGSAVCGDNEVVLACWRVVQPDGSYVDKHKFGDAYSQDELVEDISHAQFVVAHHAKFEMQWLSRCGVDLHKVLPMCTMLAQWVLDGNQSLPRSLAALCEKYGFPGKMDVVSKLIASGTCPSEIPVRWLLEYCGIDVDRCHMVFLKQQRLLSERNLWHILHTRNLTCAVLADIEFNGMTLDKPAVEDEYAKTLTEFNETKIRLEEMAIGVNLNSGAQLAVFLYETLGFTPPKFKGEVIKTKGGKLATDTATLGKLVPETAEQLEFLTLYKRQNKLSSLLTKSLIFFKSICTERKDCTFYGQFNQGITATHRLSSSGRPVLFIGEKKTRSIQFQNQPREYKRLFCSGTEDDFIGECDGAQLEFRVAAELGHDAVAFHEIVTGEDIHSNTAKVHTEAGQPMNRQEAKSRTFSPLFGGMGKTPAEKEYAAYFKKHYAGISETQAGWINKVVAFKELTTPYGLVYYWPSAKMNRFGYVNVTTEVSNYPIQGFATAEIIPIALVYFWHRSNGTGIVILNTIHDSIVNRVPKSKGELFEQLSKQCLTTDVYDYLRDIYDYHFTVPLGVGIKLSRNWGATKKETVYTVYPDGTEHKQVKE